MEDQTQLDEILNELLNNDNYFQSPPPKSTSTPAPPSGEMVPSHGSLTTHSGRFTSEKRVQKGGNLVIAGSMSLLLAWAARCVCDESLYRLMVVKISG